MNENQIREVDPLLEYYEKKMDAYSSLAKYGIVILSAVLIIFPSTYTFIHPPYEFDLLLAIAFIFGICAFLIECRVILLVDFREDSDPLSVMQNSSWGAFLILVALGFLFAYVGINVESDRSTPPRIVDIKYQPLKSYPGMRIEFTGVANDQNLDILSWEWQVALEEEITKGKSKKKGEKQKPSESEDLLSTLKTAHWTAKKPGKYLVTAQVSDGHKKSSIAKLIVFIESKK